MNPGAVLRRSVRRVSGVLAFALLAGLLSIVAPAPSPATAAVPATGTVRMAAARDAAVVTRSAAPRVAASMFTATPAVPMFGEIVALDVQLPREYSRIVVLERLDGTRWLPVKRVRTKANGTYRFTVKATDAVEYRLIVSPDPSFRVPSLAGPRLRVAPVQGSVRLQFPDIVEAGTQVTATVSMTPRRSGSQILLQRLSGSKWVTEKTSRLFDGYAQFRVAAGKLGDDRRYRVVVVATKGVATLTSNSVRVHTTGPRPTIGALSPDHGSMAGGITVTVTGTRLSGVTSVTVGDVEADFSIVSDTRLEFVTPSASPGRQIVRVSSGKAQAQATFDFEFPAGLLREEFVAVATTYVVEPGRLVRVDAEAIAPDADDQVTVSQHVVTLTDDGTVPTVGQAFFLPPSVTVDGDSVAGTVTDVVGVDGGVAVSVETTELSDVLESYEFEASTTADDGSGSVGGETEPASRALVFGERKVAAAEAGEGASNAALRLAQVGPSMFECTQPNGTSADLQTPVEIAIGLENTRLYSKTAFGADGKYVRTFVHTEPVIRVAGKVEYALDCELSSHFVSSMRRTFVLSHGFTLSIAPDITFSVSAAGEFEAEQRWMREIGYEQVGDEAPNIVNISHQYDPRQRLSGDIEVEAYAGIDFDLGWMDFVGLSLGIGIKAALEYHEVLLPSPSICVTFAASIEGGVSLWFKLWKRWEHEIATIRFPFAELRACWKPDELPPPDVPNIDGVTDLPPELIEDRGLLWVPLSGTIGDTTLDPSAPGYTITSALRIPEGVTLTIPAGTRIKLGHCGGSIHFPNQACLRVDGTLRVLGNSDLPVVFTSMSDDLIGGDTDGSPLNASSAWKGIDAGDGAVVEINHLYARMTNGFLTTTSAESVQIRNAEIRGNETGITLGDSPSTLRWTHLYGFNVPLTAAPSDPLKPTTIADSSFHGGVAQASGYTVMRDVAFQSATLRVGDHRPILRDLLFHGYQTPIRATVLGGAASYSGIRAHGATAAILIDGGTLYPGDFSWSAPLPYVLNHRITIMPDATLRFPAGTQVQAGTCRADSWSSPWACFDVDGSVVASGTPGRPVRLEFATHGFSISESTGSITLTDTKIAVGGRAVETHAGAFAGNRLAITALSSSVPVVDFGGDGEHSLRDSSIDAGWRNALTIRGETAAEIVRTRIFQGRLEVNSRLAVLQDVSLESVSASPVLRVSPEGAGADLGIRFSPGTPTSAEVGGGTISAEVTWDPDVEFRITQAFTVAESGALTLTPGTVVAFPSCAVSSGSMKPCIEVHGELDALGSAESPILFRSAANGEFIPIRALSSSRVELDHVRAEGPRALLEAGGAATVTVRNTEVTAGRGEWTVDGILVLGSTEPALVEDTTIAATGTAIRVTQAPAVIRRVTITQAYRGIRNGSPGTVVSDGSFLYVSIAIDTTEPMSAPRNWWGDPAGPPTGKIVGEVADISPWCLDAACSELG